MGVVAIISVFRWTLPFAWDWLRLGGSGPLESHGATLRNIGLLIAGVIALPLALWRSWVAERQTRISEQGLLRDRYQRGAEMLGNELLSARLGGIYALQRLAGDHPDEYHMQVIELLCAFVRHPAQAELTTDWRNVNLDELFRQSSPLREDVQAVMNAIENRSHTGRELERLLNFQLDFHSANLAKAHLDLFDLSGANLNGANLMGAACFRTNFSGASLVNAVLHRSCLNFANVSDTKLNDANLGYIDAQRTDFSGAFMMLSNLSGSNLRASNFSHATLSMADLSQAALEDVNLSGAHFGQGVRFGMGSQFFHARLTQNQLNQAVADADDPPTFADGTMDIETGLPLVWH